MPEVRLVLTQHPEVDVYRHADPPQTFDLLEERPVVARADHRVHQLVQQHASQQSDRANESGVQRDLLKIRVAAAEHRVG